MASNPRKQEFPRKSALVITALFLVMALCYSALLWHTSENLNQRFMLSLGSTVARYVAANAEDALLTENAIQLQLYAKNASLIPGVRSVVVTDASGKVMGSDTPGRLGSSLDNRESFENEGGVFFRLTGGDSPAYEVRQDIQPSGGIRAIGYVFVTLDPKLKQDPRLRQNLSFLQGAGLTLIAVFFLGVLGVLWRLMTALEAKAEKAARMAALIDLVKDWDEDVLNVTVVPRNPQEKGRGRSKK